MSGQRQAGPWVLEREIGSGSFAKVWRATHQQTQQVAAVKEINLEKLSKKLQESLASEVAVLKHTQHENIVCLLDLIRDANRLYLVLEFCAGGDLAHYIRRYRQVSEATARYFLRQLAEGLKELRRHNVIHRDLKPQNLLLGDGTSTPLLKIADFGFARSLAPQGLAETLCGSPLYMAPEILQFQKYDAKADLWSIGTILFELLAGRPPYNGANHIQLLRNIERSEARLPDHIAARLSPECRGLLAALLQRNPLERLSFEEFFGHPFLAVGPGQGQQGATGVPPPLPVPPSSSEAGAPALPPAVRQAAAAAAAAAAAGASSSVARPNLHLTGAAAHPSAAAPPGQPWPHGCVQQPQVTQQQQQQQRHHHPPPPAPLHAGQQQQQHVGLSLVAQPVVRHPLAAEPFAADGAAFGGPGPGGGGDEGPLMADSLEGDFVVVYNTPQGGSSAGGATRSSNSSSKASSGLADPKAAAVLQGAQLPLRMPGWQQGAPVSPQPPPLQQYHHQQQQQQELQPRVLLAGAGGMLGAPQTSGQQQHDPSLPAHLAAWVLPDGTHTTRAPAGQCLTHAVGQPHAVNNTAGLSDAAAAALVPGASSVTQHSTLQAHATPLQRVQLLVQVVRACVCLLTHQDSSGGLRGAASLPALQQGEQVSLLLLALQLVQLLCCPPPAAASPRQQQDAGSDEGCGGEPESLAAVLAAASQADVEQLMAAAVDLVKLAATTTQGLVAADGTQHDDATSPTAAFRQQQPAAGGGGGGSQQQEPGNAGLQATCWGGAPTAAGAAAAQLAGSLAALPMPDPAGVLYNAALDSCKGAAVEEVMGNWRAAMEGYSLAADVLLFLAQDWAPHLAAPSDPCLLPQERLALHRLYAAVNARLAAVVAAAPQSTLLC